ncbi:alpha/beta hydrolase [Yoonia sp.]|uniref:alpha/beta hydrolase n=1 Tax=Yoonia sp. TaxID=2212373 RepID=UPI002FDAB685
MSNFPETLVYRPPHLGLDLWRPSGDPKGLVVHAHGGGFVHGSRNDRIARHFGPLLAEMGLAFASISYRKAGAPRRAFGPDMLERIHAAAAQSTAFYQTIRPSLLGPALYRAAVDYADAARFLLRDDRTGLANLPWIAMGNSSGGLAAISVAHGLSDWTRPADLPAPRKSIAIAGVVPQPWVVDANGPDVALLCARGDEVLPMGEVAKLQAFTEQHGLPVSIQKIPYGKHTRPIKEILPSKDSSTGKWCDWFLDEIAATFMIGAR